MNKKDQPDMSSQFTERDVEKLIANYGVKPNEKERKELLDHLRRQKEKFLEKQKRQERGR
jgi:hypothetical protein